MEAIRSPDELESVCTYRAILVCVARQVEGARLPILRYATKPARALVFATRGIAREDKLVKMWRLTCSRPRESLDAMLRWMDVISRLSGQWRSSR